MHRTLLTRLTALCHVDVDDADFTFIEKLPFKPCNQTSNQVVLTEVLNAPHNHAALVDCIRDHGHEGWEKVFDRMSVKICANNVPLITGRVLVQTSPRYLDNVDAIVKQCHEFAAYFEEFGIPKDRYAIKVPFSGAGASASVTLNKEGIRTLATAVFCLEQAIAASQSKCLLISPYFQEIAAHTDESLRPKVDDIALEHPFSPRTIQMLELFTKLYLQTKEEQPVMVIASHLNSQELLAMAELGCPHVTVQKARMIDLMNAPDDLAPVTKPKPSHPYKELATPERLKKLSSLDPLKAKDWDGILASTDVDFLDNNGQTLDAAIDSDSVARKRIVDAMNRFKDAENKAEAIIREEMHKLGVA